jgi:hypothetical protein
LISQFIPHFPRARVLVRRHVSHVLIGIGRRCSDGGGHTLGLIGSIEMGERHVHCAMVGCKGALEPAPDGGGFSEAQPALAPQDAR